MYVRKLYLRNCSYIQFQRVVRLFYCSSNYFGSLFYPDRRCRCRCYSRCCCCCWCCRWCWRCCWCCCWFCWCFCQSRSDWLVGTWHVPFPLFVLGRRMNFCVSARCLQFFLFWGNQRNVCSFVCVLVLLSLAELQLPGRILLQVFLWFFFCFALSLSFFVVVLLT